jgi:putative two-component system response regulator
MACRQRGLLTEELDDETIDLLYKSAALHDIGKVGIPDLILLKPGKLDLDEFAIMQTHTDLGSAALANAERLLGGSSSFLAKAQEIVLTHHEKWDGSGYPRGLKAAEIPLSGRLMAIADVYDALVSKRVYKRALPHATAVEIITNERGKHFDPDLVDAFIEIADVFAAIHQRFADELSLPCGEMEPETNA